MKRRGPSPCLRVGISLALWFALSAFAQKAANKSVTLPGELNETVRKDFDLEACFQEDQPPVERQIATEEMMLTNTTSSVLFVKGLPPCLANADNFPFLIYAHFGKDWRNILRADGNAVLALPSMTVGWHDLEVMYRNSGSENSRFIYRFQDNGYVEASCDVVQSRPDSPDKAERKPCPSVPAGEGSSK